MFTFASIQIYETTPILHGVSLLAIIRLRARVGQKEYVAGVFSICERSWVLRSSDESVDWWRCSVGMDNADFGLGDQGRQPGPSSNQYCIPRS